MSTSRPRRQTTTMSIPIQSPTNYQTLSRASSSPKPPPTIHSTNLLPTRSSFSYSSTPSLSISTRQQPFASRPIASALPARSTTSMANYTNGYGYGANTSSQNRPISSSTSYQNPNFSSNTLGYRSSLTIHQPTETSRPKIADSTRDYSIPSRINTIRSVKYVPSSYNRYYQS